MNSAESKAALLGIDWGTSSLRAFLISADGEVIDRLSKPLGILQVPSKDFDAVFEQVLDHWPTARALPVLASGMITSKNGWVETPYLVAPARIEELAQALHVFASSSGVKVHFVTGLMVERTGVADVMRGEETQITGALAQGVGDGLFVLPGTHSKWITVKDDCIVDFSTFMTGEVFAVLCEHSILGTLMEQGSFDRRSFEQGVEVALSADANVLRDLFQVRTLPLLWKKPRDCMADYLSGLLIGTEISAFSLDKRAQLITVISRDDLAHRYQIALEVAGCKCQLAAEDLVAQGHFLIARTAGLLT